jgi:hypothetical protein
MKNRKTSVLLLSLLPITIVVVTLAVTLGQQNSRNDERQRVLLKRVYAEDYPIADYDPQEASNQQERNERKARNHRHDLSSDVKGEDVKRFALKDSDPDISLPLSVSHPKTGPAIPAAESDVVVVGEVTSAQAYLSNNKTSVYSEFTVRVVDVLKNGGSESLYFGAQIVAERAGGRVRFPSGKVLLRGAPYGENMPRVEQRYIFFLKQNAEGQDYSIITAYELRSGRIFPLDGSPEGDVKSNQFAEYEKYAGVDETSFFNDVRSAIEKGE